MQKNSSDRTFSFKIVETVLSLVVVSILISFLSSLLNTTTTYTYTDYFGETHNDATGCYTSRGGNFICEIDGVKTQVVSYKKN